MSSGWLSFNCTPSVSSLITVSSVHRLRNCYICVQHEVCNGNILYVWFVTVEGKSLFYSRVIYVINVPEEIEPGLCWALGRTASVCRNLVSSTGVRSHVWGRDRHLGQRGGVAGGQAEHGDERGQRVQAGVRLHLQSAVGQFTIQTKYNKSNPSWNKNILLSWLIEFIFF